MSTVFLNGEYLPKDEARISVDDRGFLFADGVYEVTPFYEGVPFYLDRHLARLRQGLAWMRIDYDTSGLEAMHRRLIAENGVEGAPASLVYLQITRGAAPRTHPFPPEPVEPTVYAFAKAWQPPAPEAWERGFTAITIPDRRWAVVNIKTIALLPNVLAYQAAVDHGVTDAIQVRDGIALEGAHNNLFAVFGGTLVTHPRTNVILPGITRGVILELAVREGIPVEERPIEVEELAGAEEVFFTGTSSEVRPTVEIDGRPVGEGRPGPVTRALSEAFRRHVAEFKEAARGATV